jgi:hypothetical protein
MHVVTNTPTDPTEHIRSYCSVGFGLPRYYGGSSSVLTVTGPAQRLFTLQPAYSRSRLNGPLHQSLRRFCCLHRRFDCYRVERTSSQVGLSPTEKHRLVTAHIATVFTLSQSETSPKLDTKTQSGRSMASATACLPSVAASPLDTIHPRYEPQAVRSVQGI